MLDYIPNDGYTEEAFIRANPGHHGEFRFKYRPMLIEERAMLFSTGDISADAKQRVYAAKVSAKIAEWSLTDGKGEKVPVSAGAFLRLKPALNERIVEIVSGLAASDTDPRWAESSKMDAAMEEYESALSKTDATIIRQGSDEKN